MHNVNWWLMVLAFVLGLLLTFAFMIRRVKREVPIYGAVESGARGRAAGLKGADADVKRPDAGVKGRGVSPGAAAAGAAAAGAAAAGGTAAAKVAGAKKPEAKKPEAKKPEAKKPEAKEPEAKKPEAKDEPYGSGSARVAAGAGAPSGYTIKGNEDSMLYHTPDSPSYEQTIAEIWFRDEQTARKAGFERWDKNK